jgi:hypothetical protein
MMLIGISFLSFWCCHCYGAPLLLSTGATNKFIDGEIALTDLIREYTDAGFRTFALWGFEKGACECGDPECKAIGKHPRVSSWQHSPCWSEEQLDNMLKYIVTSGFGVCIDEQLVIDIDPRNGGDASYAKLVADTGVDYIEESGFVVRTGGGGRHIYFSRPAGSYMMHLDGYPGLDFKTSGFVVGCGSMHASGMDYEREKGFPQDMVQAPGAILDLLAKKECHRAKFDGHYIDVTEQELADMLKHVSADCDHETWYRIGMALHHATAGGGFGLWDSWSNQSDKYPGRVILDRRWQSFGKSANPVTLGTLTLYAEQGGWTQDVTFKAPQEPQQERSDGLPFSIEGVDLLRPPGYVGEVCRWVNAQCRYPREALAVAASLVAMGNVAGLRYTDDLDGVTANLFAFCIAGSATGKESVQQAVAEIHRAAGVHVATHGAIKSEQEVIRNLIRNQAALYVIDEIGIFLQKISNAQKKGGAAYLDGVIGILMSAYSKADSFMLLTGDTKDEVRKALLGELSQCKRGIGEGDDKTGAMARRMPQLERALDHIDSGLERPFLSLIGFTTPVTFDGLVTHEQATNGFIGRSLLINEKETNPRAKRNFKKEPMPLPMQMALSSLYSGGDYDPAVSRVEYYAPRVKVATDAEAALMMGQVLDWIENESDRHKERTGLEAVVRRGYELMAKISLILAAPEGIRTAEHIRWAFAMMRRDIEEKTRLAYANENEKNAPGDALAAKIMNMIDQDHGETIAVMHNRTKRPKKEIQDVLDQMASRGMIRFIETIAPANGKLSKKWYTC